MIASRDIWDGIAGIDPVEFRERSRLLLAVIKAVFGKTLRETAVATGLDYLRASDLRRSDIHAFTAAELAAYAQRLGVEEITE